MKGFFELRPSVPRYTVIWDVVIVLEFLRNCYSNEDLSLNVLTFKCIILIALHLYEFKHSKQLILRILKLF